MGSLWPVVLTAASAAALAEACATLGLYTSLGGLHFRRSPRYKALITEDGPAINSRAPALSGRDARTNEPVATTQFLGQRLLLAFLAPDCSACSGVVSAIQSRRRDWRGDLHLLIVLQAAAEESRTFAARLPDVVVIPDPDGGISSEYGIGRTPLGLLVDGAGYVRMKGVVNTADQLAGLIAGQGRPIAGLSWGPVAESAPPPA